MSEVRSEHMTEPSYFKKWFLLGSFTLGHQTENFCLNKVSNLHKFLKRFGVRGFAPIGLKCPNQLKTMSRQSMPNSECPENLLGKS